MHCFKIVVIKSLVISYSFHVLCFCRGQQAPYGGRGGQISNKRSASIMVEHSRVHLGFEPPHLQRQPCLKVLQRLPIPSIRGTSRELSRGSLAHDAVNILRWRFLMCVSSPKIEAVLCHVDSFVRATLQMASRVGENFVSSRASMDRGRWSGMFFSFGW